MDIYWKSRLSRTAVICYVTTMPVIAVCTDVFHPKRMVELKFQLPQIYWKEQEHKSEKDLNQEEAGI